MLLLLDAKVNKILDYAWFFSWIFEICNFKVQSGAFQNVVSIPVLVYEAFVMMDNTIAHCLAPLDFFFS